MLDPLFILLHWLWLYPLCDAQEMAIACQVSESTVYRLLRDLQRIGWVKAVYHAGLLDSSRAHYYMLTATGLEQLLHGRSTSQRGETVPTKRRETESTSLPPDAALMTWSSYERLVLRLIPRLPTVAQLRHFLMALFAAAPREQAIQGRAVSVRWHWLSDYRYVCRYRERPVTVQTDAALLWQCSAIPIQGAPSAVPFSLSESVNNGHETKGHQTQEQRNTHAVGTTDQWYSALVILDTGLTDVALAREHLRRLLWYRESPERWLCYHAFPPVLVLVEHVHQIEYWRRAAREASASLHVAALSGAAAVLPPTSSKASSNPWRLHWHDLATNASRALSSMVAPVTRDALPGGTHPQLLSAIALMQVSNAERASLLCAFRERRDRQKSKIRKQDKEVVQRSPLPRADILSSQKPMDRRERQWSLAERARVSMTLGQRHAAILTLVGCYPLLTTSDTAAISRLETTSAARYVRELYALGLLCRENGQIASPDQLPGWYLSEQGLRLLAAMQHVHILCLGEFRRCESEKQENIYPARNILLPKGLATLQRYRRHLAGVYGCIASLFHFAHTQGISVSWWEAGDACTRSYVYHGVRNNLRPDAAFELIVPVPEQGKHEKRRMRCWLEWDNGTMGNRDLEAKLRSYAHYCQSKAWAADGLRFLPRLLFVVPDTGQERRIAAASVLVQGTGLRVFVTTAAHLHTYGPFVAIWRQVMPEVTEEKRQAL